MPAASAGAAEVADDFLAQPDYERVNVVDVLHGQTDHPYTARHVARFSGLARTSWLPDECESAIQVLDAAPASRRGRDDLDRGRGISSLHYPGIGRR